MHLEGLQKHIFPLTGFSAARMTDIIKLGSCLQVHFNSRTGFKINVWLFHSYMTVLIIMVKCLHYKARMKEEVVVGENYAEVAAEGDKPFC